LVSKQIVQKPKVGRPQKYFTMKLELDETRDVSVQKPKRVRPQKYLTLKARKIAKLELDEQLVIDEVSFTSNQIVETPKKSRPLLSQKEVKSELDEQEVIDEVRHYILLLYTLYIHLNLYQL
jgi:hypothetical protein